MGKTKYFDENNYEYNPKGKIGIYIIHGFTSTTYEVKELAQFLGDKGFHVRADNLPGHATDIDDCNKIKYREWLNHVELGIAELSSVSAKIYVIGISMGSILGLHIASMFPISGIVVAAPVIEFPKNYMVKYINRWTNYFVSKIPKKIMFAKEIRHTLDFYGYDQYPLKALDEYRKMLKNFLQTLKLVSCPILMIYSEKDLTSKYKNIEIIKNNISSKNVQILRLYHATHHLFVKNKDQKKIFSEIIIFLNNN